jgi:rare lipoprotein A
MIKRIILILLITIYSTAFAYTTENYPTVGIASYYSRNDKCDPWIHTTTASKEKFDESAFTCAMRCRDFGHYYKVTNLENGKSVIVKHNDFGPSKKLFEKNRIIDLSRVAFEMIADLNKGLIKVKVERIR